MQQGQMTAAHDDTTTFELSFHFVIYVLRILMIYTIDAFPPLSIDIVLRWPAPKFIG